MRQKRKELIMDRIELNIDPIIAANMNDIMNRLHELYGNEASVFCGLKAYKPRLGFMCSIHSLDDIDPDKEENNRITKMVIER